MFVRCLYLENSPWQHLYVPFCAYDPLLAVSVCCVQSCKAQAINVTIWIFLTGFFSQSSESKDDDSVNLMFTTNNGNISTTRTGLSLPLHPYFENRAPLIAILVPLSVFLMFLFLIRTRQNSIKSLPGMPMFCWLFLFFAKGVWTQQRCFWGRLSDCWLWSVDLCR